MDKVGLVSGDFVRTGGMDMPNFALAKRCAERSFQVELAAYRVAPELAELPGIVWHRVPKPLNSYLLGSPLLDLAGRRMAASLARGRARVIVNGGNCQVGDVNWVHYVHAAYRPTQATSQALRLAKSAVGRALSLERERTALRSARLVLANSKRTRQDLIELLGLDPASIHVVYYGIDPERFKPPSAQARADARQKLGLAEHQRHVAFVGALGDRRKGFDVLYSAWKRLVQTTEWDCHLLVVGHGAELARWRSRSSADGLETHISFLGFRRDVPEILAACDALIAPTRYEAFGLGVQEALCCGLPALVSRSAGVAELYPAELDDLLLDDPHSESELTQKLQAWRQRPDDREITEALARRLRARTWDTMADEIIGLLS